MNVSIILMSCIVGLAMAKPVQNQDPEDMETIAAQNRECIQQTGITFEQLLKLSEHPADQVSQAGMCYIKCVVELRGLVVDGVIQKDAAVANRPEGFSKEDAVKVVDECSKLVADDECETAFIRYNCAHVEISTLPQVDPSWPHLTDGIQA